MSEIFEYAVLQVLKREGGFVDDKNDPGGATNFGVSQRAYPDEDIQGMTEDRAKEIYRRDYWEPLRLSELENDYVTGEIFDTAVNMGLNRATKIAQESLNYLGSKVAVDGIMGPETIGELNGWSKKDLVALLKVLNGVQFTQYFKIVSADPEAGQFSRGWLKRIQL